MKYLLTVILLCITFNCNTTGYKQNIQFFKVYQPQHEQDIIAEFMLNSDIFYQYRINPFLAISQAIVEQGAVYQNYINNRYRIFNISCSNKSMCTEVFDKGENRYRKYRIYNSFREALRDYCILLSSNTRYNKICRDMSLNYQIDIIGRSGYATDPNYLYKLRNVSKNITNIYKQNSRKVFVINIEI